jgi:hypothetical protein
VRHGHVANTTERNRQGFGRVDHRVDDLLRIVSAAHGLHSAPFATRCCDI